MASLKDPKFAAYSEKPRRVDRDSSQYRRKFLGVTILLGLIIPFVIAIESLIQGEYWNLFPLLVVEIIILICLVISRSMSDRAMELLIIFLLTAYPIAYIWGILSPGNHQMYVVVLLCMPPVFDTLSPKKWYWFWLSYALTFVLTPGIAYMLDIPTAWSLDFSPRMAVVVHVAFLALWVLRFVTRSQLLSYANELAENVVKDSATGLPTLAVLGESIVPGRKTCVAIVTVGNFRQLSTLFGYSIASELLHSAAERLVKATGNLGGSVFRLRGHDFGYVLQVSPGEVAGETLSSLSRKLSGSTVLREKEIELNFRIGYVITTDGNAEKALDSAYEALGVAEREGLEIVEFEDSWGKATEAEKAIADLMTLSRSISEKSIAVFYQPVVALVSGRTAWNEALVRFKVGENKFEEPSRLMDLASTTGHWAAIEDFVFEKASRRVLAEKGPVSINIALRDLDRAYFRESLESATREAIAKNSAIIIEILEGDFGFTNPARLEVLRELRKIGCLIAIDDFGTGYSNYSRLLSMPVDIVKFDSSLVLGASRGKAEASLLRGMLRFCYDIGALTVAEGVENAGMADFVSSLGFDFGQGYYWSKPLPEEMAVLAERTPLLAGKMVRFD
jgi:EAL domain-containing protein (putative c-di-GMP-specific phosphodiesterase class I)